MILDSQYFHQWENGYIKSCPIDYQKNLAIFESLYNEAKAFGALDRTNFLERVMEKSRVTKALNEYHLNVSKNSSQNRKGI